MSSRPSTTITEPFRNLGAQPTALTWADPGLRMRSIWADGPVTTSAKDHPILVEVATGKDAVYLHLGMHLPICNRVSAS